MTQRIGGLALAFMVTSGAVFAQTKAPVAEASERLAAMERMPAQLGGFARSGPVSADSMLQVADGAILRYQGANKFMTVFLYRMAGAPPVPAGPDAAAVQSELAAAERSMLGSMRQAGPDGVPRAAPEQITGYAFAPEGGGPAFRCVEARRLLGPQEGGGSDNGVHQHEHVCVTGFRDGFLKMRVILRLRLERAMVPRREVQALVGAAGAAMARP